MADSSTIANAYIRILPDMSGIQGELEGGLGDAGQQAGAKAGGGFSSAFGAAAKVGLAATTAAGAAVGTLTKSAVESFADYEQLVGGIETLYGASAGQMQKYADDAFKNAGMSANEYMEIAIQSSAAMISSLGGDQAKAAEMTNLAMTDMSDNVNKMGTDMEAVQNAYRGFSRGNFTMLDNLALGFAGTKEGMQQLLAQATELSGVQYDIDSYADIVQAIHVVQEEMGIAGTTQKEAAETISGSMGMLKSAWSNLVTGFANGDADLGGLIGNVVDSAKTVVANLLPIIKQAIVGIGQFISEIGPVIISELPGLINAVLPALLEAATSMLDAVAQTLPTAGLEIIITLVNALTENLPHIVDAAIQIIVQLVSGIAQALPTLIPAMVDAILTMVEALIDNLPLIVEAAVQLMIGLAKGLIQAIPVIISKIPEIISAIVDAFIPGDFDMIEAGKNLLYGLGEGIISAVSWVVDKAKQAASSVLNAIKGFFGISSPSKVFEDMGGFLMEGLAVGIDDNADSPVKSMASVDKKISEAFAPDLSVDAVASRSRFYQPSDVLAGADSNIISSSNDSSSKMLTVILELDRVQLGRTVYRLNKDEVQRVGVNLA